MLYRLITLIGGLVFVAALFALVWFFCKKFLEHHGVTDQTSDRATVLATWTFAGIAIGLVFAVVGAFVLGPWAFYRTLRGHGVDIADGGREMCIRSPWVLFPFRDGETLQQVGIDGSSVLTVSCNRTW